MKTLRSTFVVLALTVVALTAATTAFAGKPKPSPGGETGYAMIVMLYGCEGTPRVCGMHPMIGAKVQLVLQGKVIQTAHIDKDGHASLHTSTSGPYTVLLSYVRSGKAFKHTLRMPRPIAGLMLTVNVPIS